MNSPGRDGENLRYTGLQQLAEGSSAIVHAALDRWTGREVVLKEARPGAAGGHGFLKEARLLLALRSPVFPELVEHDPGSAQRPARLVIERRPGRPMSALEETSRCLDPDDVAWIAVQVLQGLTELAEHGWIHGDLGPANLLLSGSRASLLDLGLARANDDRVARRSGTFQVMPPEILAQGLPHPRSDMFSLGALLFQLITGRPPFPDDPDAALSQILSGRPQDPGPGAGHPLFPLSLRCLQADPARRPSPQEALDSLLPKLPRQRAALLVPRRGPGSWDPTQLDQVLKCLSEGKLVLLRSGQAGQWRVRLDHLLLEAGLPLPMLKVERVPGQTLLDWLACRADEGGLLAHYPELARAVARRTTDPDILRQLLGFLDDQLERPRQGLCWIVPPGDPDARQLPLLVETCRRQHRPLVVLQLDGAPEPGLDLGETHRLDPPQSGQWRAWLRHPTPGITLEDAAIDVLDRLSAGDGERIAPLVARCISEGSLAPADGMWRLTEIRPPRGEDLRGADLAALDGKLRHALLRACAWVEPAPIGCWQDLVRQGREDELEMLEGAGWLRDRGDGQLVPRAGLIGSLDEDVLGQATLDLLQDLWRRPDPPAELGLLLLSRADLGRADPHMAHQILRRARGLINPQRKIQLITELLPLLPAEQRSDLQSDLATALLEQDRAAEAAQLLKALLRESGADSAERSTSLVLRLAHAWRLGQRRRLAWRLVEHGRRLAREDKSRLALEVQAIELLQGIGRAAEANARLTAAAPLLLEADPAGGPGIAHAIHQAAVAAFNLGSPELAARLWTHLSRPGRQILQIQQRIWLANNLGVIHLQAGRLEQARTELEQAGREAALFHLDRYELMARVNLALVQLKRGAADQAVRELEPALVQARELQVMQTELAILDHLGEAWAALGDLESAEATWERELDLARALQMPDEELDSLKNLLCLAWDLGIEPTRSHLARLQEIDAGRDKAASRQWALLAAFDASPTGAAGLPANTPASLRALAAGRETASADLLSTLLGLEPRLDGVRLALRLLEGRLPWLAEWAPCLREVREIHRLHEIRLLSHEGESAARREDWSAAGIRLGRAVRLLESLAMDLSPAWQERVASSPWLRVMLERAGECLARLDELDRRDDGRTAGSVGRATGA